MTSNVPVVPIIAFAPNWVRSVRLARHHAVDSRSDADWASAARTAPPRRVLRIRGAAGASTPVQPSHRSAEDRARPPTHVCQDRRPARAANGHAPSRVRTSRPTRRRREPTLVHLVGRPLVRGDPGQEQHRQQADDRGDAGPGTAAAARISPATAASRPSNATAEPLLSTSLANSWPSSELAGTPAVASSSPVNVTGVPHETVPNGSRNARTAAARSAVRACLPVSFSTRDTGCTGASSTSGLRRRGMPRP